MTTARTGADGQAAHYTNILDLDGDVILPGVDDTVGDVDEDFLDDTVDGASDPNPGDGIEVLEFAASGWNREKNVLVDGDSVGDSDAYDSYALTTTNFVHVDVDLRFEDRDGTVSIENSKRGNIFLGSGDEDVTLALTTNGSGWSNQYFVDTGAGDDTFEVVAGEAQVRGNKDSENGNAKTAASITDGRHTTVNVDLGAGNDDFRNTTEAGAVVNGGSGDDYIDLGENGAKDIVILNAGDGEDVVDNFKFGEDVLRIEFDFDGDGELETRDIETASDFQDLIFAVEVTSSANTTDALGTAQGANAPGAVLTDDDFNPIDRDTVSNTDELDLYFFLDDGTGGPSEGDVAIQEDAVSFSEDGIVRLTSMGTLDGNTVWRIRNETDETVTADLEQVGGDFSQTGIVLEAGAVAFVLGPEKSGATTHTVTASNAEGDVFTNTKAAGDQTFSNTDGSGDPIFGPSTYGVKLTGVLDDLALALGEGDLNDGLDKLLTIEGEGGVLDIAPNLLFNDQNQISEFENATFGDDLLA